MTDKAACPCHVPRSHPAYIRSLKTEKGQSLQFDRANTAAASGQPSKFTRLRNLLSSPELAFLMEAHSGLSAKIVEEAGFEGIWASGLSMSASLGRSRQQ